MDITLDVTFDDLNRPDLVKRGGVDLIDYIYDGLYLDTRQIWTDYDVSTSGTPCPISVEHREVYDDHRRLQRLFTKSVPPAPAPGSFELLVNDYTYLYDDVGNLTHATPASAVRYFQEGLVKEMGYVYDELHRLTTATHVTDGSVLEGFTYDLLGNRSHYDTTDQSAGYFYAHNQANEYTLVDTVDPPVNPYSHDAAGNLTWDHPASTTTAGYNYVYDFENRLVEVKRLPTELSPAYVTIAKYTYDALGRRIREQHFDTEALPIVGMDWTFYYDGQNVAVQYSLGGGSGEVLDRYFIHGLRYIDERAIMRDVTQDEEYYYVLGQNWNVEALLNNRGREVEHYSYDAYGQPVITAVSVFDVDFDGDIDMFDQNAIWFRIGQTPCTQAPPWYDLDGDGDIDSADHGSFTYGPALVEIPESGIGNPYAFTSRWMDHFDYVNGVPRKMLYHIRARELDPLHGRPLQRDPSGYTDGMNLYEYVWSNPVGGVDPSGLRTVPFKFYVFIPGRLSTRGWLREPSVPGLPSAWEFRTDQRGFGQHPTSRMWTLGFFESTRIGKLRQGGWDAFTQVGESQRRLIANPSVVQRATAALRNNARKVLDRKCASRIEVSAEAAYPFIPGFAAPPIRYSLYLGITVPQKNKVKIDWTLVHTSFPDNELMIDREWEHQFPTPFTSVFGLIVQQVTSGSLIVDAKTPKCCP